ncbi:hypothetical protein F5141DRAFT_722469 [Pisolithus sp. B1]|nr:hypothetical protein F5141DRAFT_722469 [Pisolithus sp. B1]
MIWSRSNVPPSWGCIKKDVHGRRDNATVCITSYGAVLCSRIKNDCHCTTSHRIQNHHKASPWIFAAELPSFSRVNGWCSDFLSCKSTKAPRQRPSSSLFSVGILRRHPPLTTVDTHYPCRRPAQDRSQPLHRSPPPGLSRASSVSRSFTDREGMPTPMPCLSGSPCIARNASRTQLSASPVCPCRANDPVPHSASVVRLSTSSTSTRDMLLVHCPLCKRGVGL